MTWSLDARIPVSLLPDAAAVAAALATGKPAAVLSAAGLDTSAPGGAATLAQFEPGGATHAVACVCCQGRGAAAQALDALFQGRARGTTPWFDRVLALDPSGEVAAALREDAVASARFRRLPG
jgi:hypothetical protein